MQARKIESRKNSSSNHVTIQEATNNYHFPRIFLEKSNLHHTPPYTVTAYVN